MMTKDTHPTVAVRTENGVPVRVVWNGIRYRVSDTPTPLRGYADAPFLTHPLEPVIGWRFQGTPEHGETVMFDVARTRDGWELISTYR